MASDHFRARSQDCYLAFFSVASATSVPIIQMPSRFVCISKSPVSLVRQGQHWSIVTTIALVVRFTGSTSLRICGHLQQKKVEEHMAHLGACSCLGALVNSGGRSLPCFGPARKGPPPRFIFFVGTVEHRIPNLMFNALQRSQRAATATTRNLLDCSGIGSAMIPRSWPSLLCRMFLGGGKHPVSTVLGPPS